MAWKSEAILQTGQVAWKFYPGRKKAQMFCFFFKKGGAGSHAHLLRVIEWRMYSLICFFGFGTARGGAQGGSCLGIGWNSSGRERKQRSFVNIKLSNHIHIMTSTYRCFYRADACSYLQESSWNFLYREILYTYLIPLQLSSQGHSGPCPFWCFNTSLFWSLIKCCYSILLDD